MELSYQLLVHCTCLQTLVESDFIVLARILYPGSQIEETFSQYLQFKMGEQRICLHNQIMGTEKMSLQVLG